MARAHRITAAQANRARWERHHSSPDDWFWGRVDRSGGTDACWPWLSTIMKTRRGYGRLVFKGRHVGAHRMALSLASGGEREGLFACHRCDNPVCCNPRHLFWGTPLDNTRDCLAKGRRQAPHPRKINREEAASLRAAGATYSQIAARYGVNQASVAKALRAIASKEGQRHG